MKKMIVGLTMLLSLASFTTFARGEEKVSQETLLNFQKEFKAAENVSWSVTDGVATASFNLNGFRVQAYFANDAQLLGTARTILFDQLPIAVINSVNNRFATAPVYEIVEYTTSDETFYCMTIETTNKKFRILVTPAGDLSVQKRVKK